MQPVIFIMGPTAVGKSAVALEIAQRIGGELINVDSAQIYRGLDIGTAKPSAEVRAQVPHHLLDIRDPAQPYSAAEFVTDAQRAIAAVEARHRVPILVGGTGLYFQALEQGLSPMPSADRAVRARLEALEAEWGSSGLHERLQAIDPEAAARLHPNDSQRIQRALEVYELTGEPLSAVQRRPGVPGLTVPPVKVILEPQERCWLHERIERRLRRMYARGLVGEVAMLRRRKDLSLELPSMRAVGYRQTWLYLEGDCDHATMVAQALRATRQYAKRQLTWLRRQDPSIRLPVREGVTEAVHRTITERLGRL